MQNTPNVIPVLESEVVPEQFKEFGSETFGCDITACGTAAPSTTEGNTVGFGRIEFHVPTLMPRED
ncbi:hypothetical protein E2C01_059640 [Portunus trituberculatus]|uniref:Uncharacterized protein n=1 Tax=Portunus trituberculatus TaxID=210409 RepID=A0A5B7H790_PORTR|nr:hypothetical protein [Portunus trituberculatus]